MEWDRFRGPGRGSAAGRLPARLREPAHRRRSRASKPISPSPSASNGSSTARFRGTTRRCPRRRRFSVIDDDRQTFSFTGQGRRAAAADARLDGHARHRVPVVRRAGSTRSRSRASITRTSASRSIRSRGSSRSCRAIRPQTQDAYETGDLRFGLEAETVDRLALRQQRLERVRRALHRQPLGIAAGRIRQLAVAVSDSRCCSRGRSACSSGSTSDRRPDDPRRNVGRSRQPPGREPRRRRMSSISTTGARPGCSTGTRWGSTGRVAAGTAGCAASRSTARRSTSPRATSCSRITPDFEPLGSWRNRYLKHCHEICRHERTLFLTSTGFDSILGFDLDSRIFSFGLRIEARGDGFVGRAVRSAVRRTARRPRTRCTSTTSTARRARCTSADCALAGCWPTTGANCAAGSRLPAGVHNAQPFRDGVLFNDTAADVVRWVTRERERTFPVPRYPAGAAHARRPGRLRASRARRSRAACASWTPT